MLEIGIILALTGIGVTILNERIAISLSKRRHRHHERFSTSVTRQNIVIVGAVCMAGGLIMLYLSYFVRVN